MQQQNLNQEHQSNHLPKFNYEPLNSKLSLSQLISLVKSDILSVKQLTIIGILFIAILFVICDISIFLLFISGPNKIPIIISIIIVILIFIYIYISGYRKKLVKLYKIRQFAVANNIVLYSNYKNPNYKGLIFKQGYNKVINYAYVFESFYDSQIGSFSYTTGNGSSSKKQNYGYIKIDLPRQLPHMLLDSKQNNFLKMEESNLPASFTSDQKLSLEGNFNNYFTLYAPKQYERDALYIFTPDVMQAILETATNFDIEIIDNQLYMYSQKEFNLVKQEQIELLLSIIAKIAQQFYEQSEHYADINIGNRQIDRVAPQGKRLKSTPILAVFGATSFIIIAYISLEFLSLPIFIPLFIVIFIIVIIKVFHAKKI